MSRKIILAVSLSILVGFCFADNLKAIEKRIKPVGEVTIGDADGNDSSSSDGAAAAEKNYQTYCSACHAHGVSGAPKLTDKADWKKRFAKGKDKVVENVIKGIKLMPPKGTCMSCSDEELKAIVEYIQAKSK